MSDYYCKDTPPTMQLYTDAQLFCQALPQVGRIAALDYGSKTVGTAVGDLQHDIALPCVTLTRQDFAQQMPAVRTFCAEHEVVAFVVGLPLHMNGQMSPRAQASRDFARRLCHTLQLPVFLQDERLSTAAVERQLIAMDVSRAKRAKVIDAHAAAHILTSFFLRRRHCGGDE